MSFFEVKKNIDKVIYLTFNLLSDFYFFANKKIRKDLCENKRYFNKHSGERCFILGTGPSINNLNQDYVQLLSKEVVFGVNFIYKSDLISSIHPNYYVLMDNLFWGEFSDVFQDICSIYKDNPPIFIVDKRAKHIIPEGIEAIGIYAKNYPVNKIRYDLSANLSITMNVIGTALLSSIYMGFKEIYLLGCDYNLFCSRRNVHCYDEGKDYDQFHSCSLSDYLYYYHLTTEFHYLIARLANSMRVKITNLTPGSLLDAYPLGSLDEVFGAK